MPEVSLQDFVGSAAAPTAAPVAKSAPVKKSVVSLEDFSTPVDKPSTGFLGKTGTTVSEAYKSMKEHPLQIVPGGLEALAAGAGGLGIAALAGLGGVAGAVKGAIANGDTAMEGFTRWKGAVEHFADKIPLAPETEVGNKLLNVLGVIPEAIHAGGETVYGATKSPLLAAGTEAVSTLLLLKPSIATKALSFAKDAKTPEAKATMEAFDQMATADPAKARQIADHVDDKKLQKDLNERIDSITVGKPKQVKEIFKQAKERGPGAMAVSPADLSEIMAGRFTTPREPGKVTPAPVTPEQASANLRNTIRDGWAILEGHAEALKSPKWSTHPPEAPKAESMLPSAGLTKEEYLRKVVPLSKSTEEWKGARYGDPNKGSAITVTPNTVPGEGPFRVTQWLDGKPVRHYAYPTRESAQAAFNNQVAAERLTSKKLGMPYEDPVVYMHMGIPVTKATIEKAFSMGKRAVNVVRGKLIENVPHYDQIEKEVSQSIESSIRAVAPETLGKDAKAAAAVLGKNQAIQMRQEVQHYNQSETRRTFWNYRMPEAGKFIEGFERGQTFADPILNKAAQAYKQWNEDIFNADQTHGIKYDPRDNYLYHVFEDGDKVADYFARRYGPRWGDPKFTKERGFSLYSEAVKAGFRPKFTNPEDIMLFRQAASDIAHMRVSMLNELEQYGLARKAIKGESPKPDETEYRSPAGERFWVKGDARQILHNAFDTRSIWQWKNVGGAAFRGAMGLKNAMVPVLLNLSLYHPVHVMWGMYNGAAMARVAKEAIVGSKSPARAFGDMLKAQVFWDFPKDIRLGGKLYGAYQGKVKLSELSNYDRLALQYMDEGGLVPQIQSHFKMQSIQRMKDAFQQGHVVKAAFHVPFAIVQAFQHPTMEVLIPRLKVASYIRDVESALRADPSLHTDPLRRMEAFRKIMKQTENRFGEMAYNQRFWNHAVKDTGVASSLSMGWTLGFLDEFGAGPLRAAKSLAKTGSLRESAKAGDMDQALFVGAYITSAMLAGGLITYAMTGQPPKDTMDYVMPRTGETNPDGTPARLNTPFYTREYVSIGKHIQEKGLMSGAGQYFANKATPVAGHAWEWFVTNQNYFGQELSDPDAPLLTQVQQKLASTYKDLEPISLRQIEQRGGGTPAEYARSLAGFGPAPSYVTQTHTEAMIKNTYSEYHTSKTPYQQALYSADRKELRTAYQKGDMDKYQTTLENLQTKYNLSGADVRRIEKGLELPPIVKMFQGLTDDQQRKILDKMTPDEREQYLPRAKKKVQADYIPPEER